ncbi:MAG: VCBS repeat-containing protein [Acidobacteriota bacterium]
MKVIHLAATLALTLTAGAYAAADKKAPPPAPPPPGVRATTGAGYRRIEVVPEGRLLGVVAPLTKDGQRRIVLLMAPADGAGPRSVAELLFQGPLEPALHTLAEKLSPGIDAIDAIDLDGDGAQEVVLGEPGHLYWVTDGGARALDAPGWFDLLAPWPNKLRVPSELPLLVTAQAGRLRCFAPAGSALRQVCDQPLPLTAEREPRGLFLQTPAVNAILRPQKAPLIAIGPQSIDKRRLRTLVIDPQVTHPQVVSGPAAPAATVDVVAASAGSEIPNPFDAWSRLPTPEQVQDSWYFLLGGKPVLAVSTVNADKLGIFEHLKLRVFRLAADRTRVGRGPVLAVETESPRWHDLALVAGDLNGDGNDDLVLIEPKGMDGKPILAQAFLGDASGGLRQAGNPSKLDLEGVLWSYGQDVTGDGRPDLVAAGTDRLQVFAGQVPDRKGPLIETAAIGIPLAVGEPGQVEVQIGSKGVKSRTERYGWMRPVVADLDGDRRGEILLLALDRDGPGVLEVITWR